MLQTSKKKKKSWDKQNQIKSRCLVRFGAKLLEESLWNSDMSSLISVDYKSKDKWTGQKNRPVSIPLCINR